jgi:SAM-dependent methyltransferase
MRAALIRKVGHRPLLYIRRPSDRKHDSRGTCSVCGARTTFVFNSWVVPKDMKAEWASAGLDRGLVMRETMYCSRCCASLRVRRLGEALVLHYAEEARTVAELVDEEGFRGLEVAEINSTGALHSFLARHPGLQYSEFRVDVPLGAALDGVRNEDVCCLAYPDDSFDVVLTADTLEHVPDYRLALKEIHRILRPGGRHIFTVPAMPSRQETFTRATVDEAGAPVFRAPPQYHGRGSGLLALASPKRPDYLAYHDFGMDLLEELSAVGFRAETHYSKSDRDSDVAFVFCAQAL